MNERTSADVIVVGLGAFGSATVYQLARRGATVIGIDRFEPPHTNGSSHGATRITRLAVGEGEIYVPLAMRSHEIWRELEASAPGRFLYLRTGGIIIGAAGGAGRHHGRPGFVRRTIDIAMRFGIPHETLEGAAIAQRFPQFMASDGDIAYCEPDAGVLRPEACVRAQIEDASAHGASIRTGEQVLSIEGDAAGALVRTDRATYTAGHVIVTAGPWIPGLVGGMFASHLKVMRQVLYWFKPLDPSLYAPRNCPIFIWSHGAGDEDVVYGFPMVDGHVGVKVATEQYRETTDPDRVDRTVPDELRREMFERHVAHRLRAITDECVHTVTCLYTVSPDGGFVVDRHPAVENVTVVSACSGHGFKHSAALGEQLALRALGERSTLEWDALAMTRFAAAPRR